MSEENPTPEEIAAEAAKAKELADAIAKAEETNKSRTGKGTRVTVKSTRGRSTQVISFEAFDLQDKETLPTTISEFMDVAKVSDEPTIMGYILDGFNSAAYDAASDPVLAFVDKSWKDDVQKGFRLVVRNTAANAGLTIEEAVALIKPAYVAAEVKRQAALTK